MSSEKFRKSEKESSPVKRNVLRLWLKKSIVKTVIEKQLTQGSWLTNMHDSHIYSLNLLLIFSISEMT